MVTDRGRETLYAAERMAHLVFEAPGTSTQIGGVTVTVPPEASANSRARRKTASNIGAVRRPVFVLRREQW